MEATKDDEVDTIDEALEDIDEDEQAASSEADAIVAMDVPTGVASEGSSNSSGSSSTGSSSTGSSNIARSPLTSDGYYLSVGGSNGNGGVGGIGGGSGGGASSSEEDYAIARVASPISTALLRGSGGGKMSPPSSASGSSSPAAHLDEATDDTLTSKAASEEAWMEGLLPAAVDAILETKAAHAAFWGF